MYIRIDISSQRLGLFGDDGACVRRYRISTATKGPGEEKGSYQTPRGRHIIRARIGAGVPIGAAFRGRRPTIETAHHCVGEGVGRGVALVPNSGERREQDIVEIALDHFPQPRGRRWQFAFFGGVVIDLQRRRGGDVAVGRRHLRVVGLSAKADRQ